MLLSIHSEKKKILKVDYDLAATHTKQKHSLSLLGNLKHFSEIAFIFEDVPEDQTVHIHQLSLANPKISDFYYYLNNTIITPDELYSHPEKETILIEECNRMIKIVANYSSKILILQDTESEFVKRQLTLKEMGIIDACMTLAESIQQKLPKEFSRSYIMAHELSMIENQDISCSIFDNLRIEGYKSLYEVLEVIYRLVYRSIKGNSTNSLSLDKHEQHLVSYLPGHIQTLGKIIKERFKFVAETSKFDEITFKKWFENITTLKEMPSYNIREQTLYMDIMNSLCENNGAGVLRYQSYALNSLANNQKGFTIMKFRMVNSQPAIAFEYDSRTNLKEFLEANPRLAEKRLALDIQSLLPNEGLQRACFYLKDIYGMEDYTDYLASSINFLAGICLNRYKKAIRMIIDEFNVKLEHIEIVIKATETPEKLRCAYFKLCRVLYIDIDPFISCSSHSPRCYLWSERGVENPYEIENPNQMSVMQIKKIVWKFWSFEGSINQDEFNLGKKVMLITEILKLTRDLVDLGLEDDYFINYMLQPVCLLLSNNATNDHWCAVLMRNLIQIQNSEFTPSLDHKVTKMLEEVLHFLQVAMKRRQNRHVQRILELYKSYREIGVSDYINCFDLGYQLNGIMKELDFNVEMRSREAEETLDPKTGGEQDTFLKDLNIEQLDYINNEDRVYALDIYLLELLFNIRKTNNKKLSKVALQLIIKEINQRKLLRSELKNIEIITNIVIQDVYEKMCILKNQLSQSVKILRQSQEESEETMDKIRYVEILKDVTDSITEAYHMFKTQSEDSYRLEKYQNLCRHSGLHEEFISILYLPYDNSIHFPMIRNSIKVLYYFSLSNRLNQKLVFQHKDRLLDMIGYKIGATRLFSTIVSRNYDYTLSKSIVLHLFELIDKDEFYHQFLELVRSFLLDDEGNLLSQMQIEILKLVFLSSSIKSLHKTATRVFDFVNPKLEHLNYPTYHMVKFHVETIQTLTSCAIKNRFGIYQCRKLLKYAHIKKALQRPNTVINLMCKKYYLRFLYHVYLEAVPGVDTGLELDSLQDLLREIVLNDLRYYKETLVNIVDLAYIGLYSNIHSEKAKRYKIDQSKKRILEASPDELSQFYRSEGDVEISDHDRKILEYWNYLSGSSNWHSHKDGLLYIIRDIFRHNTSTISEEILYISQELRITLNEMSDVLSELEKDNLELDFSNIIIDVNTCRESLPLPKEDRIQSVENEIEQITTQLREFIIDQKLSLDEAFSIFDVNKNGEIDYEEFRKGIKAMLGKNVKSVNIEKAFIQLDLDHDGLIELKEFSKRLRKYFSKNSHPVKKRKAEAIIAKKSSIELKGTISEELKEDKYIKKDLKEFISAFKMLCQDQDIHNLVVKIRSKYIESALITHNYTQFKEFIFKLNYAFKKQEHLVYLLHILRLLIPKRSYKTTQTVYEVQDIAVRSELDHIKNIQNILSGSNVIELALNIISKENNFELIDQAIQLLLSLLRYGNLKVQQKILNQLKQTGSGYLMSYIRTSLRNSRDRIVDRSKKIYAKNPLAVALSFIVTKDADKYNIIDSVIIFTKEDCINSRHTRRLLKLLQAFTENCYSDFQSFLLNQATFNSNSKSLSINLVNELASFLINIKEIGSQLKNDQEAQEVIPQCFETLIDLCRGPCVENQLMIGSRRKFYKFLNVILDVEKNNISGKHIRGVVRLLKALLEGETRKEIAENMIEEINFPLLSEIALDIYRYHIHTNKELVLQEWVKGEKPTSSMIRIMTKTQEVILQTTEQGIPSNIWNLIDLGFDIVILIVRLRTLFPHEEKLNGLSLNTIKKHETRDNVLNFLELGGRNEKIWPSIMLFFKNRWSLIKNCIKPVQEDEEEISMETAYIFYASLITSVEIDRDGQLEVCYFRVPTMMAYMSSSMRRKVVLEVNRSTYEEKIKSFFYNSEKYEHQLSHLQIISRFRFISWWACKTKALSDFSFLLVILLNVFLLISIKDEDDIEPQFELKVMFYTIAAIVSVLAIANYILYIFENYPTMIYEKTSGSALDQLEIWKKYDSLKGTLLMRQIIHDSLNLDNSGKELSYFTAIKAVMVHSDNIYCLFYAIISLVGWINPLIYSILLLDVMRRSEILRDVLKSITMNRKQLILVMVLAVFILYQFGIIGFVYLGEYYTTQDEGAQMNNYCNALHECVFSSIYHGIMAGGGLGDVLLQPVISDNEYWNRQFFDIFFFIIVSVVLLNIVFGIIIDTFAELRDSKQEIKRDLVSTCFICGRGKYEFEMRGSGWNHHTQIEHNVYAYLAYIIYIRRKPLSECDGIEMSIKKKILQNDVSFIPETSKCIEIDKN